MLHVHCTCAMQHVTSLRYIFRSFPLLLLVFLLFLVFLFLSLFSLVVGFNFVCLYFLVMVNVFGTLMSGVSCILANNWANYFVFGGGGTYLNAGANSNVYSSCVQFN